VKSGDSTSGDAARPLGEVPPELWSGYLPVGDGHEIYVETAGSPAGIPAVFLHGGPGSGCQPEHRTLFAGRRFHAVLFDQRGAGRSRPHGRRLANTTDHLIEDMEIIRQTLGFEKWLVVGGSWGATLALAYAERHPERVIGIVLRATFLGTRTELDGAFRDNLARFYPPLHRDFLNLVPEDERCDPLSAYWRRILGDDAREAARFAYVWAVVERALASLVPPADRLDLAAIKQSSSSPPASAFMEAHYFSHDCFLAEAPLLENAHRLKGIPGIIIQGRYDLLCPPATAYALAARWPGAEVRIVEGAGHLLGETGVRDAVVKAIADVADQVPVTQLARG